MAPLDGGALITGESELRGDTQGSRPVFSGYAALKLLDLIRFWLHSLYTLHGVLSFRRFLLNGE